MTNNIENWAGQYATDVKDWGATFSPLVIQKDGTLLIATTQIVDFDYDPKASRLSFDWTHIGNFVAKVTIKFKTSKQGVPNFQGTINPRKIDGPVPYSGKKQSWSPQSTLAGAVAAAGFWYSPDENMFYSKKNPWQRLVGYTLPYDYAAPFSIGGIIDCEPIYFDYDGASWMIEFWKGQYGMELGAEIGIYRVKHAVPDKINSRFKHWFPRAYDALKRNPAHRLYWCVGNKHELNMSWELYDTDDNLIISKPLQKHWWLTGWRWGEYVDDPSSLTLKATIKIPSKMKKAVRQGFVDRGYSEANCNFQEHDNIFSVTVTKPYFPQPYPRSSKLITGIQARNKKACAEYRAFKDEFGISSDDPNVIEGTLLGPRIPENQGLLEQLMNHLGNRLRCRTSYRESLENLSSNHTDCHE